MGALLCPQVTLASGRLWICHKTKEHRTVPKNVLQGSPMSVVNLGTDSKCKYYAYCFGERAEKYAPKTEPDASGDAPVSPATTPSIQKDAEAATVESKEEADSSSGPSFWLCRNHTHPVTNNTEYCRTCHLDQNRESKPQRRLIERFVRASEYTIRS